MCCCAQRRKQGLKRDSKTNKVDPEANIPDHLRQAWRVTVAGNVACPADAGPVQVSTISVTARLTASCPLSMASWAGVQLSVSGRSESSVSCADMQVLQALRNPRTEKTVTLLGAVVKDL